MPHLAERPLGLYFACAVSIVSVSIQVAFGALGVLCAGSNDTDSRVGRAERAVQAGLALVPGGQCGSRNVEVGLMSLRV